MDFHPLVKSVTTAAGVVAEGVGVGVAVAVASLVVVVAESSSNRVALLGAIQPPIHARPNANPGI